MAKSAIINRTVEAAVPETGERVRVRFSNIQAERLAQWARQNRLRMATAGYDAAQTNDDNRRHWANADNLSAASAHSPAVRATLRKRSRYEVANNSYAKGIVSTLANHVIGTGPRLAASGLSREAAKWLRGQVSEWGKEIGLASKLRVMRRARCQDGEAFGALVTNLGLDSEVKLDLRTIEADQVCADTAGQLDTRNIDGVILDVFGNPESYQVLPEHPGDYRRLVSVKPTPIPAAAMCHWFAGEDRPGIRRGVPEITPALPLFAQLRRYTLAVIAAAETAAEFAGVIESDASADDTADEAQPEAMDTIETEKRMLITLPKGWKASQLKAEQPTTTYGEFKREIIKEIARCLSMPYNIAAGDSSTYNFASGRLDHGLYVTACWVDREEADRIILRKLIRSWLREARLIPGYLPDEIARTKFTWEGGVASIAWHWDALELGDPFKVASTRNLALSNGTTSLPRIYAEDGYDFEDELQAQAEAVGVTVDELRKALFNKLYAANTPALVTVGDDGEEDTPTKESNESSNVPNRSRRRR